MPDLLPRVVAHADWSTHPGKRWLARAVLQPSGRYHALPPEPVGALADLLARLEAARSEAGTVLLGVDFPIGLPRAYATGAGIDDFVAALPQFGAGRWRDFYAVARRPAEIRVTRPFYPHHAGEKGTVSRRQLSYGLGLADPAALRRRCDLLAHASPLFWTLGAQQVGRAAISGWRDLLGPALRAGRLALWPFGGPLARLLAGQACVVAESYPAEFYRHLALPLIRPGGGSKRRQASRRACAPALFDLASDRIELHPRLAARIADGFGPAADGEDPFDATVGLFGVLNVVLGRRACAVPDDPAVTRVEGWILGQAC